MDNIILESKVEMDLKRMNYICDMLECSYESKLYCEDVSSAITNIIEKIKAMMVKILDIFGRGALNTKAHIQGTAADNIIAEISKLPVIKLKIPNVWDYSLAIDDLIDKRVKRYDKNQSLNFFSKKCGEGKVIDKLTKHLNEMVSQLHNSQNKAFTVSGSKSHEFRKNVLGIVGATGTAVGVGTYAIKQSGLNTDMLNTAKFGAKQMGLPTTINNVDIIKIFENIIITVGKNGPFIIAGAAAVAVISGLAILATKIASLPKKISVETTNTTEIANRIKQLAPEKFAKIMCENTRRASDYLTNANTLKDMSESTEWSGATEYASKISRLLVAYSSFHQAMIDYYLSILSGIIAKTTEVDKKKLYKPVTTWTFEN